MKKTHSYVGKKERRLLMLTSILCALIILCVFGMLYSNSQKNIYVSRHRETMQIANEVYVYLSRAEGTITNSAQIIDNMQQRDEGLPAILNYLTEESRVYAQSIDSNFTGMYGVFDGTWLDGTGWEPDADYVPEERPWYLAAKEAGGQVAYVTPYLDAQTKTVMISLSRLLSDNKSVVSMDISMDEIQRIVRKYSVNSDWDSIMILDGSFFSIAHSDPEQVGMSFSESEDTIGNAIYQSFSPGEDGYFTFRYDGKKYVAFVDDIGGRWHAVTVIRRSLLFRDIRLILYALIAVLIMLFAVLYYIFLTFSRKRLESEDLRKQIKAVSGVYLTMHQFDLEKDTITEITVNEDTRRVLQNRQDHAQYNLRMVMDKLTEERFKKSMFAFIDLSTLSERLKGKKTLTKEFVGTKNGRCCARFVPVEWGEDGQLKTVIWMVEKLN